MTIDPNNLPAIPTLLRQWIYFVFLLALLVANCIDAFYHDPDPDPWWLPGALRVLNVIGLFIMAVVLAHTRSTVAEQEKKAAKDQGIEVIEQPPPRIYPDEGDVHDFGPPDARANGI